MYDRFETVISGISGRFPDCENVPEFRDKLYSGKSFMSLQPDRWPVNYRYQYSETKLPPGTGKFRLMKEIDPVVFKVNTAVAECMDAMNRKVLEPAFEAVMDAGINPYDLSGRHIGVYMAYDHSDSDANSFTTTGKRRFWVLGSSKTMMANRVSFALNLTGPSLTYCNDLFGNLTAINEAYKNVSEGHVEAAIVGAAAAVLHPHLGVLLARMNILSMDSLTKVFDKNATGYGRSDAAVTLFIQKSEDAKRIYASIDFSGGTYFGSNPDSILNFDEDLLTDSFDDICRHNNVSKINDVSFVEMSACGIKKLDKVESNFIADVFCKNRSTPLIVGSVKSNVGNAEGIGPFVSLMKAIFALESDFLVPNQNLSQINDEIRAFAENQLEVAVKPTRMPGDSILVNSVGMTGALSQVVLKRNINSRQSQQIPQDSLPRLILASARTEDGIINAVRKLQQTPFNAEFFSLVNDVFSTDMPFHVHRGYSIQSSDIKYIKKSFSDMKGNKNRPVWFLFSGMGSQWNGMGKGLLDLPIIAETVAKCDKVLKTKGVDIYHILTTDDASVFDNIMHSFVGIITIQIALVEVLKALGIEADGIIGHSVGENACAYADGCLTLEQAVLSSHARGMASIETETIKGMMAAIGKGYNEMKDILPQTIEVACHNSSSSCTLSGPADDVNKFVEKLQKDKIFAKAVNVANIAYHSKHIAPAAPNLLARLQKVIPVPIKRSSKWISTSVPEAQWNEPLAQHCSAEYLTNNLLKSVLFEEGSKHIPADALVIEIAPHGLLQAIMKRSLPDTCTNVPLTRRNTDDKNLENLLAAIGQIYIAGPDVNVNALYPPIKYPVSKDTPAISDLASWNQSAPDAGMFYFELTGSRSGDPVTIKVNDDSPYHYLRNHKIHDRIILPISFFMYLTWWAFSILRGSNLDSYPLIFENVKLFKNVSISLIKPQKFYVFIHKGSGKFEILKSKRSKDRKPVQIITGLLYQAENSPAHVVDEKESQNATFTISRDQFYQIFEEIGYKLKDPFMNVEDLKYNKNDCYTKIKWQNNWVSFLDSILKLSMFSEIKNKKDLMYIQKIRRLEIQPEEFSSLEDGSTVLCHQQFNTNITSCNGIKIYNVESSPFTIKCREPSQPVGLEGLRFVSHKNPGCQNVEEFVKLCLQIASSNVPIMTTKINVKLNVIAEDSRFSSAISRILKQCNKLKSQVILHDGKYARAKKNSSMDECYFIATDYFNESNKFHSKASFLLVENHCNQIEDSFVKITEQQFANNRLRLFKKKLLLSKELPIISAEGVDGTSCYISKANKEDEDIKYVIKKDIDKSDLSSLVTNTKNPTDPRYLFIMDKETPSEVAIKNQLMQDLPVAVLQNGEWGSYRNTNIVEDSKESASENYFVNDIQLNSIRIQYFNRDNKFESQDKQNTTYGIEYSGINNRGERIMGLSLVDSHEPITEPDPKLIWQVPNHWSLEDATTVPFIYAQAYHIFDAPLIRGKQYLSSVLINIGKEFLFSQACISISLSRNYTVYVAVANDLEADLIKKRFPQIEETRIFNLETCSYQHEIFKITKGFGVSLVVNCLPEMKHIEACLNSVGDLSYCVQIGRSNSWEDLELGLFPFGRSVSFASIANDISSMLKLPEDHKAKLREEVEEGIRTGVVVPFERNVQIPDLPQSITSFVRQNYKKTIYEMFPNKESYNVVRKIRYDDKHSYLIIGGDKKDDSWFELVEWLVGKGVRKFIAAVENFAVGPKISHRINRLLVQKKICFTLSSFQETENPQNTELIIKQANKIAPLEAVFFVSAELAEKRIQNVDLATRQSNPNIHLISVFSGGLKECESRRRDGFSAVVIHRETSSQKVTDALPLIDELLSRFDNNNSPTLYCVMNNGSKNGKPEEFVLKNYIPSDISTLEEIADEIPNELEFIEVTTKAPRLRDLKDCDPIFIISTLGPVPLRGLLSKLLSPTFCATIGCCDYPAEEQASKLYTSLISIQSKATITLISETWSSPVAFELLKLLDRNNKKYKLFTLESNPVIWKERAKILGPIESSQFENNLIKQLFNLNNEIPSISTFAENQSLPEKISTYLSNQKYPVVDAIKLAKVVNSIHRGLRLVFEYEYSDQLLKNTVSMSRTKEENEFLNLSVTGESFIHQEETYRKFLNSDVVSKKINGDKVYTFWYD